MDSFIVMPAKAGIPGAETRRRTSPAGTPAFAGVTKPAGGNA
jgi:hypothetical protein